MKMIWLSQPTVLLFIFIFCFPSVYSLLHCAQHDQSTLLRLKHSLVFDSDGSSNNLESWNSSSDCCVWGGVTCSRGDVVDLDLSSQSISGGLDPLFDLHHLRSLDLSYNNFNGTRIPSGIGKLANLLHLDLSYSRFGGQVPIEISSLTSLLTLKIVGSSPIPLKLENPKFSALIKNFTNLIELELDGVNMSAEGEGHQWGHALSSSLPNLRALSLRGCSLSGPLHDSLGKLQALTSIDLSYNNLSAPLPDFLANFSNLTSLMLSDCGLYGDFPQLPTRILPLQYLNLGSNKLLSGTLPEGIGNMTSLTDLYLYGCGFSGSITHIHWENLESLQWLLMNDNELSGSVPMSLFSLPSTLQYLDLSSNKLLSGTLPEGIGNMTSLEFLRLDGCGFSGSITHIHWENLESLAYLIMFDNELSGSVPMSLFSLPSMVWLELSSNQFSGQLGEVDTAQFEDLGLSGNKFEGPIPTFILNLGSLVDLRLDNNNFSGTIDLTHLFQSLGNISILDLSSNSLSIIQTPMVTHFAVPQLSHLHLSSCNLTKFPSLLRNQSRLRSLDLSQNKISWKVPNWIWVPTLLSIDLSDNLLVGFETLLSNLTSPLEVLNLKSNLLKGQIPVEFGNYFPNITFLSLSNNNLHGTIRYSFCNFTRDDEIVIDLSNNSLSGTIPPCLLAINLGVLNLKKNNLRGSIPDTFPSNCFLETLDLSENQLQGTIPESMVNCTALKVINFRNNQLSGGFPCWLIHASNLTVLVLRSNRFYGPVRCALSNEAINSWSKLQIIDIAANSFDGELPHTSFKNWTTMIMQSDKPKFDYLAHGSYYQDTVTINNKGNVMELVKILNVFNAIDLSCNYFEGSIPESIGDLKYLRALNLSHNHFRGSIPPSIGNLKEMESLDLANNNLSGVIPEELASLNFISYLNLSFNHLVGKIPTSTQLQSFSESSYTGNKGLWGPPLEINCGNRCEPPLDPSSADVGKEVDWKLICVEIGYAVGLASVIGSLVYWKRWNVYFFESVDRAMFKVFPSLDPHKRNRGTRSIRCRY